MIDVPMIHKNAHPIYLFEMGRRKPDRLNREIIVAHIPDWPVDRSERGPRVASRDRVWSGDRAERMTG